MSIENIGPDSVGPLAAALAPLSPAERLALARESLPGGIVLTTSFGLEDQVLTHLVAGTGLAISLATLDTGRLHPETYTLWRDTEARYGLRIAAFYPRHDAIEDYVLEHGIDGFYGSIAARKACCGIRKVEPLGRALAGAAGWVTGLRADQSAARDATPFAEWNAAHRLIKINPLADWSRPALLAFAEREGVPLNPLHARGFPSIGCAPCTRAVQPGEPERAGRWWWENEAAKECGLHVGPDGRLVRAPKREEVLA